MDACRGPTGVTRHALAQLDGLSKRNDIRLNVVSGRIREPDGLACWEALDPLPRRELPCAPATPYASGGSPAGPPWSVDRPR